MSVLRLILGDQLSDCITALDGIDAEKDHILMCEVMEEATYVKHHQKKIAFLFSAMRHFAERLQNQGYQVDYIRLDNEDNTGSFTGEVARAIQRHQPQKLVTTFPGEYRLAQMMAGWSERFGLPVMIREDERFLCSRSDFADWAEGRRQFRMEYFYRQMRREHQVLMEGEQPCGGRWNFDAENRKSPDAHTDIPSPCRHAADKITGEVLECVARHFSDHFGTLEDFHYAVTREQALAVLHHFIEHRLPLFGDYQDAMIEGEPWMFHAHLGLYLNCGLLLPEECIRAAEQAWRDEAAPLNAVEGFVRQILGWREYVRGIYWLEMPEYRQRNFLDAQRPLPSFYWDANTPMNCLHQCVSETRQNAYAHHIQRLMVLGNFALLVDVRPADLNEWYLLVYADAYEWVELPNVSGMVLFADGGLLASKPYAAGGNYIKRMSNYCDSCSYSVNKKNGDKACPFNYLYWDFLERHQSRLKDNPRLGMMYRSLERMSAEKRALNRADSQRFLDSL